jgi:hypothetical protein
MAFANALVTMYHRRSVARASMASTGTGMNVLTVAISVSYASPKLALALNAQIHTSS